MPFGIPKLKCLAAITLLRFLLIDFKVGFSCQITHVARAKNNIIKSAGFKFFEIFGIQIKQKCRFLTNECLKPWILERLDRTLLVTWGILAIAIG